MMDGIQQAALFASNLELRVESSYFHDDLSAPDFRGPELILVMQHGKLVQLSAQGRAITPLSLENVTGWLELALATEGERGGGGADTAEGRPITALHLSLERYLPNRKLAAAIHINHYSPSPLPPRWTALLTALRLGSAVRSADELATWDFATAWLGPTDLGVPWSAGQVVPLPLGATAFLAAGPVYLRAGQRPQQSELYRYEGDQLTQLPSVSYADTAGSSADGRSGERSLPIAPLTEWHLRDRWVLPCGGGSVIVHRDGEQARLVVHAVDPQRPLYVQRG